MKVYMLIKRIMDLSLSLSSLVVLGIPILVIGILIKMESKGSIFSTVDVIGRNGKSFEMYEFRTMVPDNMNQSKEIESKATRIGKFLIKTRLHEAPRVINIIKGEMSIIGPAPIVLSNSKKHEEYSHFEKKRFDVSPGTIGLAQLAFGEDASWDKMIIKDVEYTQSNNFKMDTDIFIKTLFKSIAIDNIYFRVDKDKDKED